MEKMLRLVPRARSPRSRRTSPTRIGPSAHVSLRGSISARAAGRSPAGRDCSGTVVTPTTSSRAPAFAPTRSIRSSARCRSIEAITVRCVRQTSRRMRSSSTRRARSPRHCRPSASSRRCGRRSPLRSFRGILATACERVKRIPTSSTRDGFSRRCSSRTDRTQSTSGRSSSS